MTDRAEPGYCPNCGRGDCAPTADEHEQQRQRAARAEATLREVLDAFEAYWARASYCGPDMSAVQPEHFQAWRATLTQPPAATEADTAIARVRVLRDDLRATTGARYIADALDKILDGKQPPARPRPACRYCPDPRCPESCPECGSLIHDLDAVPPPPACSSACSEGHTYGFRCEQQRPPTPAPPVPCPACRRADQAGLAPDEQHDDCTKEQQ